MKENRPICYWNELLRRRDQILCSQLAVERRESWQSRRLWAKNERVHLKMKMKTLKGLVLSGGRGTRLRPLSHTATRTLSAATQASALTAPMRIGYTGLSNCLALICRCKPHRQKWCFTLKKEDLTKCTQPIPRRSTVVEQKKVRRYRLFF
jgi:hypothetical protein